MSASPWTIWRPKWQSSRSRAFDFGTRSWTSTAENWSSSPDARAPPQRRYAVQVLTSRHPAPVPDPAIFNLTKLGFNHVCFAVDDLATEVAKLEVAGVRLRNEVMDFHGRKLVFLSGPEGITVELAEWD